MSDFEKWFKSLNKNGRVTYFLGQEGRISEEAWNHQQAIIDEHTEVIKIQDADLRKYEKQIESLKAQLNNMEACYIEKKKEVEDQQKRIDDVEAECKDWHRSSGSGLAVRILEVLRGDNA
ncbi:MULTISPECIES: hypothetical protein [Acinetobacter]|uniref:hypothetical protein n=1 Tax=Acinetobacter TaxID=469 RepID=UPI0002CE8879|nr:MULTISPECIES: hypothetical protein [Acinetobacter]ENX29150.1 hypothetical protein F890_02253 [Acinetobacter sp. CIP 64.7]